MGGFPFRRAGRDRPHYQQLKLGVSLGNGSSCVFPTVDKDLLSFDRCDPIAVGVASRRAGRYWDNDACWVSHVTCHSAHLRAGNRWFTNHASAPPTESTNMSTD